MRRGTRASTALTNLGRQAHGSGKHLTDCKVCPNGIYVGQAYRWLSKPLAAAGREAFGVWGGQTAQERRRVSS